MSQVNPEDVKAFLGMPAEDNAPGVVGTTESQMPGHEVVNLEDIRKDIEEQSAKVVDLLNKVGEERSKVFEPDKSSIAHLSSWVFAEGNLKVDVDDKDKSYYIKSLLTDTPLILTINLEVGISFEIKALTNFELDVVFRTLEAYSKAGEVSGPAQYASLVQQCAAALQIIRFGERPMSPPKFEPGIPMEEAVKSLQERITFVLGAWDWPKWQAAITALRIFEAKLALCNENARQANFWQTAGAN